MKNSFCATAAIAGLLFANTIFAQEKTDSVTHKKHHALTLSQNGMQILTKDSTGKSWRNEPANDGTNIGRFTYGYAFMDLGINLLQDNTNYNSPGVKSFLNVPVNEQNKSLFDLRTGKSINVNIYPMMVKFAALKTQRQRIYISSGLGLQLYNFRYEEPITYTRNPSSIILVSTSFKKDKLGLDYLNIPLMFTFKTRLNKDNWLVYGAGVTEGYRICSWTKQESSEFGKVKLHDAFGLADFNTCISAELGLEGVFRFFATYQVTSLYSNGLDQHPVCFGIRFGGS